MLICIQKATVNSCVFATIIKPILGIFGKLLMCANVQLKIQPKKLESHHICKVI